MRSELKPIHVAPCWKAAACAALLATPLSALAQATLPPISVGAGVRASFAQTDRDSADEKTSDANLDSARIYLSGGITDNIKFMFNTEYDGADQDITIIDAVAMFSFSDKLNIWAGRFLPPSDRANLYGPYYTSHWGIYRDGVQDGYPFETTGRDDGVMYWGQFGITKVSFGAFGVPGANTSTSDVLWAGRVQLDFWDKEDGYYLNGSYYGAKDLLAIGVAGQAVGSDKAYSVDFLLEKKLGNQGVVTFESEYAKYDLLGGYRAGVESDGYYALGAYLFPQQVGIGKFQILGKFGETTYKLLSGDVDQTTTEFNLNYIIKDFNARVSLFLIDQDYDGAEPGSTQFGIGLQVQM